MFKIILLAGCLSLAGCDQSRLADNGQKRSIRAPGIERLQSLSQKADVFYQTRDYVEADKIYRQIVALDAKNLKAHYRLGNIAFRSQDWRKARDQYEKVIEIQPRHIRAQYNLSMTYLTMAERHLKFYAANVGADTDLRSVAQLITALEEVSNPSVRSSAAPKSRPTDETPLNKLLNTLAE